MTKTNQIDSYSGIFRILLIIGIFLLNTNLFAQETELIPFKIKDQFNNEYTEKNWGDSILIFIGSDKNGSQFNAIWGAAIGDSINGITGADIIKFIPNADLRGVPFFLKGYVRGKFPKEKERWTLMDWKGVLPKAYHYKKDACNILIFDQQQKLVHQAAVTEFDQQKLDDITTKLKTLLK